MQVVSIKVHECLVHLMCVDELENFIIRFNQKQIKKLWKRKNKENKYMHRERSLLWRVQSVEITGERYWREVVFC